MLRVRATDRNEAPQIEMRMIAPDAEYVLRAQTAVLVSVWATLVNQHALYPVEERLLKFITTSVGLVEVVLT